MATGSQHVLRRQQNRKLDVMVHAFIILQPHTHDARLAARIHTHTHTRTHTHTHTLPHTYPLIDVDYQGSPILFFIPTWQDELDYQGSLMRVRMG